MKKEYSENDEWNNLSDVDMDSEVEDGRTGWHLDSVINPDEEEEHAPAVPRPKRKKKWWLIPVVIVLLLVLFCAVTYLFTPMFMVHPTFDKDAYAKMRQIPTAKIVNMTDPSGNALSGWMLDYLGSSDLVIYYGGITEDASSSALRFYEMRSREGLFAQYDVAVVDWPGYGKSSGKATEESLKESALSILSYFSSQDSVGRIIVIAYSMGTGPAIYAASKESPDEMILIAPYYNACDLYNGAIDIFHGPLEHLLRYKMPANEFAAQVELIPTILASPDDDRVPFESSRRLADCFPNGSNFIRLDDLEHGDFWENEDVLAELGE